MKKIGGLLIISALLLSFLPVSKAAAEECANTSTYGAVNLSIPDLSDTKGQTLWVRMQTPTPDGKILAEINGRDCLTIGGDVQTTDWSWQTWEQDGNPVYVDFERPDGNFIKLIGVSDGVKIDRILLTKDTCVPEDYGTNCRNSLEQDELTITDDVSVLTPPSNEPVAGKILLSNTPQQYKSDLEKVEYSIDGKTIQTATTPEPFDTSLVENGKYKVNITTTLKNGEVFRESTVIDVKNSENVLTPIIRWIRHNMRIVSMVGAIIGGVIVLTILLLLVRAAYKRRKERSFHGF